MNINPIDLRGPEFLALYGGLLLVAAVGVRALLRASESGLRSFESVAEDPYRIARLRGDNADLLLVSVVSLLERDFVETHGGTLFLKDREAMRKVRRPLDRAILSMLSPAGTGTAGAPGEGRSLSALAKDGVVRAECDAIQAQLASEGYVPDARCWSHRILLGVGATAMLWVLGFTKLVVALGRGHHNVGLLVLLLLATPIVVAFQLRSPRTTAGDKALARARDWYARLRDNRFSFQVGNTSSELTCLAAVYGVELLPVQMLSLLPARPPSGETRSSSSEHGYVDPGSSSSCSSGSSSSCGGGGGCGGCGGGGD